MGGIPFEAKGRALMEAQKFSRASKVRQREVGSYLVLALGALFLLFYSHLLSNPSSKPMAANRNLGKTRETSASYLRAGRHQKADEPIDPAALSTGPPMFSMTKEDEEARLYELVRVMVNSKDAQARAGAIQDMGDLGDVRSLDFMIQALRDESPLVRTAAAEAIGRTGDYRALPHLSACLTDSNALVRTSAVRAIGSLGTDEAIDELIMVLNDDDPEVRMAAVEVLGTVGRPEIAELLDFVTADPDARVSETAALVSAERQAEEIASSTDDPLGNELPDETVSRDNAVSQEAGR